MIKKTVKNLFNILGYDIIRRRPLFTMLEALNRCSCRGLMVQSVIDVGASDGRWSELCMGVFPDARYLLIEAQECHRSGLKLFRKQHPDCDFVLAAAGNKTGKIFFNNSDPFGGVASEQPFEKDCTEVPLTTIDCEVERAGLKSPFLIKLDTHGFEVPILEGAKKTIEQSNLIIIETYNYRISENSLKYHEMSAYMEKLGFSSIEMADLLLRKKDNSLWQMDTFYIPSSSREFLYRSYE